MTKSYADRLIENFYEWEVRGRGWTVYPHPVDLEPPFRPFHDEPPSFDDVPDDGRRPTWLSCLWEGLWNLGKTSPVQSPPASPIEPIPALLNRARDLVELQILGANKGKGSDQSLLQVLQLFASSERPIALELVGVAKTVSAQLVVEASQAESVQALLSSYAIDSSPVPKPQELSARWKRVKNSAVVVEFGLAREFMWCLENGGGGEPLTPLLSALAGTRDDDTAVYQVIAQPTRSAWAAHGFRSLQIPGTEGAKPLFGGCREILSQAQQKFAAPLFAAVVRIAVAGSTSPAAVRLLKELVAAMRVFSGIRANELLPLSNDGYDPMEHQEDLLQRRSRRTGMLLNTQELSALVRLPDLLFQPRFAKSKLRTRALPDVATAGELILGRNAHGGQVRNVFQTAEARVQHTHILGASGMGKSSLLLSMLKQDLERGSGFLLLDPHGDLVDQALAFVPPERRGDVILLDPADEEYPISFNVLSAHSDLERTVLASDLVGIFKRYATSWGDQMTSVFGNAILAFLENTRPGSLLDLRRFLLEPGFRHEVLRTVTDPEIAYFWKTEFPVIKSGSLGPLLTRIDTFLRPKLIRYMVGQKENRLDFASIMNGGKVVLAKLSQGLLGEENAFLLGSLILARIHQTAIGRQELHESKRRPFFVYMDEFHNFITPSLSTILSGARKYRLGLILAHQELRQLEKDRDVAGAVLANAYTRICFRVAEDDARRLAEGFSNFTKEDLINLGRGDTICRMERSTNDFSMATGEPPRIDPAFQHASTTIIRELTRWAYAVPRARAEEAFRVPVPEEKTTPPPEPKPARPVSVEKPQAAAPRPRPPPEPKRPEKPKAAEPPPVVAKPDVSPPKPVETPSAPKPKLLGLPRPGPPTPPVVLPETPSPPIGTRTLGRGGREHKAIQQSLKKLGSELGFVVDIEKPVKGGSVDVHFVRGEKRIACEICLTRSAKRDIDLLRNRLEHGFFRIFVISSMSDYVQELRNAVADTFKANELESFRFCSPEDMSAHLLEIAASEATQEVVQHGRKVRVTYSGVSPETNAIAKDTILKAVAEAKTKRARKPRT